MVMMILNTVTINMTKMMMAIMMKMMMMMVMMIRLLLTIRVAIWMRKMSENYENVDW
jgi:hypothetical protein